MRKYEHLQLLIINWLFRIREYFLKIIELFCHAVYNRKKIKKLKNATGCISLYIKLESYFSM